MVRGSRQILLYHLFAVRTSTERSLPMAKLKQPRYNYNCWRRRMDEKAAAMARLQASIDAINKRLAIDSNDLDYETHLRQKRQLQQILDRMKEKMLNK